MYAEEVWCLEIKITAAATAYTVTLWVVAGWAKKIIVRGQKCTKYVFKFCLFFTSLKVL